VEQIDQIFQCIQPSTQRAMFSATMFEGVEELAQSVLRDPLKVVIGVRNSGANTINQKLVFVGREEGKLLAIRNIVQEGLKPPVLIFLQSKDRAKQLYHELLYDGINVGVIHADRTQQERDETVKQFRIGKIWVLIATDVIARGLDFMGVNMVINYDLPQNVVSYIHRIGRTGRAGRQGEAITLYTERDMDAIRSIANVMKYVSFPSFLCHNNVMTLLPSPPFLISLKAIWRGSS
jgi:ATP-dependent RNA helicase DDX52/ROK1